jgi:hypothetical protein
VSDLVYALDEVPYRASPESMFLYCALFDDCAKIGISVCPRVRMKQHTYAYGGAHGQTFRAGVFIEFPEEAARTYEAVVNLLRHRGSYGHEWFSPDLFPLGVVMVRDPKAALKYGRIFMNARDVADCLTYRNLPVYAEYGVAA